ncbi:Carbamoyl-phosphate synthase [Entomophthora muscae]|uniref:Carbamoyl-phosphate synthase n=1 Tax=Entomophthora muscae TaxID=34485 RepID=A0ACC2RVG4_9FUNG|nr:Carbamoyl-phosphate synthase [Entomophthora muscae]
MHIEESGMDSITSMFIDRPEEPTSFHPISAPLVTTKEELGYLQLQDGTFYQGISFGAAKTISGECVFQTGMVGYAESLTDPSYEGQILVLTFPLIGNYGVPSREAIDELTKLPKHFESNRIHIAALIVGQYNQDYSHFLASSSLGKWLQESGIPALYGVDTRSLTKKIRSQGVMLGKLRFPLDATTDFSISSLADVEWTDPNARNLVAEVSTKEPKIYSPDPAKALRDASGRVLRVLGVDVGIKYNQIRCFVNRGIEFKVVPWNYDFNKDNDFDGLFISNGPGDPKTLKETIANLRMALDQPRTPIFGICLGHQLLALASGATTSKLKFGNRGHNIPCTDMFSGRCLITSQNHGYAVDAASLPDGFQEYFVNANDGSNEGIIHKTLPFFSVQFHPESTPGPRDAEVLFDTFITAVKDFNATGKLLPLSSVHAQTSIVHPKDLRSQIRKVLILGSGGLSIGQAGEFDYSGAQAIKSLKEENIYTILINPNIATIQTSKGLADKVYFLPVTPEYVRKVIQYEKPDGIYVTFGGQTALNVGIKMKDEFEGLGVNVLGTSIDTIIMTEDRELFAQKMLEIGEKCAQSQTATNASEALEAVANIGYPVIVRAAYALGGLGSGFAENEEQLLELCNKAFASSPQILVERSMKGWKEVEYEVVRDCRDNCITVCNMENFDPLGIHTGDSIVVAPSQTLSDEDYNMLRTTAVNVIRHLGVVGECNIQYALNPNSREYCIIEVNARLSRSSALASKATGYPLAFVAAKLGLNIPLNEIRNSVTKVTSACFEPSLDYVVVKIPRWDLKKFTRVSKKISSSMKSVGEVMAIGRTFEETIQKAIRSIDNSFGGFSHNDYVEDIDEELVCPSDQRLFAIAAALHSGYSVDKIWEMTKIDKWFLNRLLNITSFEKRLENHPIASLPASLLRSAKQLGFSDGQLAKLAGTNELALRKRRLELGIKPFVKQIDTVAAEFPAFTNYLYLTYNGSENDVKFEDHGVIVLGSGVYRIGSSVEFDWCAVRAIRTLRDKGIKTVMINYNPETVSTDYDEADRLYFENITLERVLDIYQLETSSGVILSMGGQTPNNIALPLMRQEVKILGTSPEMIDTAENRYKFSRMLDKIGVDQPQWKELTSFEEASEFCNRVDYPVLVRPSYVLSGAAMNVVFSPDDLSSYLSQATAVSREFPVVISKYIEEAKEIEMDAVALDGKLIMHVVSEHVENAGVHSGDATLVLPPQDLDPETVRKVVRATEKICDALAVTGPFNIQFIAKDNEIKVIECNLRAARSFPFVSKVVGVDLIEMATLAMLGMKVQPYPNAGISLDYVGVKVPQFSFSRLLGADPILGVEMASTGEVACFGKDKYEAYIKALIATGFTLPKKNILLSIGSFKEKMELMPSVKKLHELGFNLFATAGTADFIQEHGVPVKYLEALDEDANTNGEMLDQKDEYSLNQHLANNLIDLYINLPSKNRYRRPASYMSRGYRTRRMAVDYEVPLITNVKCAKVLIEAIARCHPIDFPLTPADSKSSFETQTLPGLVNMHSILPSVGCDVADFTKKSLAAGFTALSFLPFSGDKLITNKAGLGQLQVQFCDKAYSDFMFSVAVTQDSMSELSASLSGAGSLFIPDSLLQSASTLELDPCFKVAASRSIPIIAKASGSSLASLMLLASLNKCQIHLTDLASREDLEFITLAKGKGLDITCDVSIHRLLSQEGDAAFAAYAWENISIIDCFSAPSDWEKSLTLLLSAVAQGRLTIEDVVLRLHINPLRILHLSPQPETHIEVEIGRPLSKNNRSVVQCVVLRGKTIFVDGASTQLAGTGKDLSDYQVVPLSDLAVASLKSALPMSPLTRPTIPADSISKAVLSPEVFPPADVRNELAEPTKINLAPNTQLISSLPSSLMKFAWTASPFFLNSILTADQFSREELHTLFGVAQEMRTMVKRGDAINLLRGRILCSAFYEPSTRTSTSFETAMLRLGGQVVSINESTSSAQKGESLSDTIQMLNQYGDAIVLRHPTPGAAKTAADCSTIPVINAGDGIGEHPTQAFLDIFTIREELGTVQDLTVTLVGDLKHGRTVHSLVKLLSLYRVKLNYVHPEGLGLPEEIMKRLGQKGVQQKVYTSLTPELIASTDVLYVTRVQRERFSSQEEYLAVKDTYVINNATLAHAKPQMVVMHPLPRLGEIDVEVDTDPRAAYFRQARYGLFVRMALLALVIGVSV